MSDIAKKTLPPGSRPANQPRPGSTTEADGSEAAPRSVTSPQHEGGDGKQRDDLYSENQEHYTHNGKDLSNISEEDAPIRMNSDEGVESLDELDPEPTDDNQTLNGGQTHRAGTDVGGPPQGQQDPTAQDAPQSRQSGSLTERAKKLFDLASQNQPTQDARDHFLEMAQSTDSGPAQESVKSQRQDGGTFNPDDRSVSQVGEKDLDNAATEYDTSDKVADDSVAGGTAQQEHKSVVSQVGSQIPTEARSHAEQASSQIDSQAPTQLEGKTDYTPSHAVSQAPTQLTGQTGKTQTDQAQPDQAPSQVGSEAPTAVTEQQEGSQEHTEDLAQSQGTERDTQFDAPQSEIPSTDLQDELAEGFAELDGARVNKMGYLIDDDGKPVGRVTQGVLQYLIGKCSDASGNIYSSSGKIIGRAEPLDEQEKQDLGKEPGPFEGFSNAVVDADGMVRSDEHVIGKVVEGDIHRLRNMPVDNDGDILDRRGEVIGKAIRWEEPEPEVEPEVEVDRSMLAGKRCNKMGNVVDSAGTIWGKVVSGDLRQLQGRMCNKNGEILSEDGTVIGQAEPVPEGEREGLKEGPFAELKNCTVARDGTIVTPAGDVVGRLISGDAKVLAGRPIDADGEVLDANGSVIGRAERWTPEEVEKKKNPMSGRKVNREGNVVDVDGNMVGKLTTGNLSICAGCDIDDDGDVLSGKGQVVGHCSLLEEIPQEEEKESAEDVAKREQADLDRKLAQQMSVCVSQCLERVKPICKMITEKINSEERKPEDERDEEQLVREVKPLIEEGGRILSEATGIIKGLDPDGRISANAKHKTAAREASPEEYHLADVLKELTGEVTQTIENSKRKLEDMPHAKKELNPLWGLLNEPLFQILAAVGLLLNGVLSLVGRLLSGLGLGGLVDGLLGTLGINRVLEGLGLGSFSESLAGGKGKKKGSGGLLGGLLGGGK